MVTAAHCLAGRRLPALAALVGADNLCRTAPVGGVRVPLAGVRVDTGDDVALLRLAHPVGSAAFRHWAPARGLEALGWGRAS